MNHKKKLAFTVIFLTLYVYSFAQGALKGLLTDSSRHPLGLATITIFKANDTSLITYRLSNPEGIFKVTGLPVNTLLRAVISYSGFLVYRKEFSFTSNQIIDWGTVVLTPSTQALDEVLVVAERPPVTVRRDTIEFNASSFKTLPTALVEDLLKKLPGVQVASDGSITANGKKVNRIMVDGKAFFGDDPKMATQNLPANVIDKVQITTDKDEAASNIDGNLANLGKVINLTLKKGIKKGWFGKVYGGAGTDGRYEVGGIANIYRDTLQLSILGFSNNLNRSGFSFKDIQDLAGFNRSGFNSVMMSNRNGNTGFAINGVSFGGLDNGITQTTGAGFNLNHAPNKNTSFFLQYFFGRAISNINNISNAQQFFHDTTVTTRTTSLNLKNNTAHMASAGMNLKPDTLTDITFRSGLQYTLTGEDIHALIKVSGYPQGNISTGNGLQNNHAEATSYNHSLNINRRSKTKKGRGMNFTHSFNYTHNLGNAISTSDNQYEYPVYTQAFFDQKRLQQVPAISTSVGLNFSEPLSKKWKVRWNNRYSFQRDSQEVSIYNRDPNTAKYDYIDLVQGNGLHRIQQKISSSLLLFYKLSDLTLSGSIEALAQSIDNRFRNLSSPVNYSLFNFLPGFSLNWKQLSAQYRQNINAPSINYLNPLPDSTNPFFIRYGNPFLKPAKENSFDISNFNFFQGTGSSYNFYINGSFIDNDVIEKRTVDAKGVQTIIPVNASGSVSFYAGVGFGKEYKNKQKLIFSFRIAPFINFERHKIIVNNNVSTSSTFQYGPNINIGLNWNDIVEFRPQYSPFVSSTHYTDPFFKDLKTVTQYLESELIIRFPKKFVWESFASYRYNSQVAAGLPNDNLLWNAALTLLILKENKGMLKLSVYDILNRNNGYESYTTQNQVIHQQTNVLKRFAELSFTYNIRNLGASKKVGGRDRMFFF